MAQPLTKSSGREEYGQSVERRPWADFIQSVINDLHGEVPIRLLVSVLFPTNLDELAKLAEQIEVWIHLGDETETERLHGQFHSKIVLVERADGLRSIVIGSHNWTANALTGGNLEASVVLTCDESNPVVKQTRAHLNACRQSPRCEPFKRSRLSVYKELQEKYHPKLPRRRFQSQQLPFIGLIPFAGLVILAEDHTGGNLAHAGVVFIRIPATWDEKPTTVTPVWLFVFDKQSLFQPQQSMSTPFRLEALPETISRNPDRLRPGTREYVIPDIERPCVMPLRGPADLELQEGEEWAVINFHRIDQRELLPVFHAGGKEPLWTIKGDSAEAGLVNVEKEIDSLATMKHLVARSALQVPFQFAYPVTASNALEDYQPQELEQGQQISYRAELKKIKGGISRYVCAVTFRSEPRLTEAVHNMSFE